MKILNKKNKPLVNSILTNAFIDNKSVNYVLRRKRNSNLISKLIDYSIKKAEMFGDVWLNEENNGGCILIDPKRVKISVKTIFLDLYLIIHVVGISNIKKVLDKEDLTKKYLPKNIDYIHLWFIGIDNRSQGLGYGSRFMNELIKYYSLKKDAICLETSTEINIPFYQNLGFEIYHIENFGFNFYFLIKYLK